MANTLERLIDGRRFNPIQDLSLTPFRELSDDFDRMGNLISDLYNRGRSMGASEYNFTPACEITEADNAYLMKVDIPGVPKEAIKVEVNQDVLTITAERKEEKEVNGPKRFMSEIFYGCYCRSFALPGPVDDKKIEAKLEEGVLTVKVPKTLAHKSKEIPVH